MPMPSAAWDELCTFSRTRIARGLADFNLGGRNAESAYVFVGLAFSTVANAIDYGRWLCDHCSYEITSSSPTAPFGAAGDVIAFIKATPPTSQWKPSDTMSICDGVNCIVVIFRTTAWYPLGGKYADPKIGYKNSRNQLQPATSTSGSSGSSWDVVVTGHWEWYDYYSNGSYTHSDDFIYIIDSIFITYHNSGWNHRGTYAIQ